MFYLDVKVELVKVGKEHYANIYKSIKKKAVLLLIPDDISIQEELSKEMNVKVNFCDTAKLMKTNDVYYKNDSKNCFLLEKIKNFSNSENYAIINKVKNAYIKKNMMKDH